MSSDVAIRARGLSKVYAIFDRPQDRLKQMFVQGRRKYYRDFWALRDVDLDVFRGETVGIIGRNGSGKSTLLQLICGTLTPSAGSLDVHGRIAALLELGAGFNSEFTGRENVFMYATLLGVPAGEIQERFPEIAAFADIGDFIDQPVKAYSSGMYARLAFAVAINVQPDILVVDEALSVGDEVFQRKCFARIEQIKNAGATILFVSHAASAIVELCDRAILLDQGERLLSGTPKMVVAKYQKLAYADAARKEEIRKELRRMDQELAANAREGRPNDAGGLLADSKHRMPGQQKPELLECFDGSLIPKSTVRYATRGAEITDVQVLSLDRRQPLNVLLPGKKYIYAYKVHFSREVRRVHFGMMVKSSTGLELGGMGSHSPGDGIECLGPDQTVSVEFVFHNNFLPGTYFTNAGCIGVTGGEETFVHRIVDAFAFRVIGDATSRVRAGHVDIAAEPSCKWSILPPKDLLVVSGSSQN